ncbi:MAG: hypothetical protein ACR2FX_05035 [Chthoniobacterales bacterium]
MNLFVLTPEEKRVVAFVMAMILVGVCVKEYRKRHPVPTVPIQVQRHPWMRKLPPLPSPTPEPSQASDSASSATPHPRRSRKPRKRPALPMPSPVGELPDSESVGNSDQPPPP